MADEKWYSTLTANIPAADAARQVLTVRLAAVRSRLGPAVESADEDTEHVHQLRVASRRTAAALRTFADCLPEGQRRAARKLLRGVRRAAGDARDWEVFAAGVRETDRLNGPANEPARAYLLGLASGCRAAAQARLTAWVGDHAAGLDRTLTALTGEVQPPACSIGLTAGDLAARHLGDLFGDFSEQVATRPKSTGELHRLRIAGKRLRYAIEIFAGCFPPTLKEAYYPAVETAQDLLGKINDSRVAADRLAAIRAALKKVVPTLAPVVRPGLDELIAGVKTDAADGKQAFRRWRREWLQVLAEQPPGDALRPVVITPAA